MRSLGTTRLRQTGKHRGQNTKQVHSKHSPEAQTSQPKQLQEEARNISQPWSCSYQCHQRSSKCHRAEKSPPRAWNPSTGLSGPEKLRVCFVLPGQLPESTKRAPSAEENTIALISRKKFWGWEFSEELYWHVPGTSLPHSRGRGP